MTTGLPNQIRSLCMSGRFPWHRIAPVAALGVAALVFAGCSGGGAPDGEGEIAEEVIRHNIIGTSLLSQQKWGEAQEQFAKGIEERPDDPVLLVNMAVAMVQQAREQEAETFLTRALEAAPDDPYAHYNMGLIEKNRGNLEGAARHFASVAAADPEDVSTHYNLAAALSRLDRLDEAEASFRSALQRDPTHVSSLYGLGRLLLQQGREEEGAEMIARSQKIRAQSGLGDAMGTQYGEQGPYAMGVDYPGGGLSAPEPIAVTFRTASAEDAAQIAATTEERVAWILKELGAAKLRDAVPVGPHAGLAHAIGDVDGDGSLELVSLLKGDDSGWSVALDGIPTAPTGGGYLAPSPAATQPVAFAYGGDVVDADLALVDRDHDGDLDLFGCAGGASGSGCFVADNDGSGSFSTQTADTGLAVSPTLDGEIRLGFSDFDNDRDIDLIAAEPGGVHLFGNLRDGSFENLTGKALSGASVAGAASIAVADLDKNGWMDLVAGTPRGPVLLMNHRASFSVVRELAGGDESGSSGSLAGAVLLDYDNDGFLDIAALSEGRLRVYRNEGLGNWSDTTDAVLGGAEAPVEARPVAALDLDGDGDVDLSLDDGSVLLNDGGNANRWIAIAPEGVGDNKSAIGTKVEILAGALRQKFEITEPLPVHAGLGHRDGIDAVRFVWPGGVLQDELDLRAGKRTDIAQLDRKGTSCPLLYAWRDGGWRFVTDFLGGCAIGYRHSPDTLSTPDTDEYVKIEGGIAEEDGFLRLRLNNQLEEVIWFDKAGLVVVDHPEGTEVYPNERLMPGPPWPEFLLYASSDIRPIASAREVESGRDVTERASERDRLYLDGFRLLPFKGYAEMHTLEVDLGDLPDKERVVLLLDGWIDYADSTANIAAHQAGAALVPPRLQVADGSGGWKDLSERMGFPAGLPKTMSVDLTGAFASGDHRIRIATTMRIYWDRIRVMVGGEKTPLRVTALTPHAADLRFGGFPKETSPDGRPPFDYDPERVDPVSPWKAHAGRYTSFGDVTPEVSEIDDRFVTTRAGDEIELRFEAPAPPETGWTRSYLLYADGFGKDMDANSAANNHVGPVPFHGMPTYPYGPDVVPPAGPADGGRPDRVVVFGDDGLPGATPLPLQGRAGR